MITRVVITLIVAMIACFTLQKQVMDVLRAPVEQVWAVKAAEKLPEDFAVPDWERAKKLEHALIYLDQEQRSAFLETTSKAERFNIQSVRLLRAAIELEGENRSKFLDQVTSNDQDQRQRLDILIEKGAEPEGDGQSDLRYLSTLKPTESFMLSMKLSFFSGIVVSFPLLLYYILQFVLPGMHTKEKKMLWPAMIIGFGLFLIGVCFAYFIVLPRALVFFASWDESLGIGSDWRIGWYISFATQFTLLFGLSFELPVVVMVFVKLGLLNYEMMHRTRAYAVLAIVIVAAMITPTSDVVTLSLMAVPMYLLYETCIWLAWYDERKKSRSGEKDDESHISKLLDDENDGDDPDDDPDGSSPSDDEPDDDDGDDGDSYIDDYGDADPYQEPELDGTEEGDTEDCCNISSENDEADKDHTELSDEDPYQNPHPEDQIEDEDEPLEIDSTKKNSNQNRSQESPTKDSDPDQSDTSHSDEARSDQQVSDEERERMNPGDE